MSGAGFNDVTTLDQETVTTRLVDFALKTSATTLPHSIIERAELCILDGLGCALAGALTAPAEAARAAFHDSLGSCTIIGGGQKVSARAAAFINAILINALDFDDDNGVGHPTATILAALLAVGETRGATGEEILSAFVCGYEISTRIGRATWPSPERYAEVWGVGTHQVFGAVIAAGLVAGLDRNGMLDAFGIAGTGAPIPSAMKWGWGHKPLSWIKDAVAWPALSAVVAVDLANHGFRGCRDFLDGRHGFWVMAGSDRCDFDAIVSDLGNQFTILSGAFKPYPCCRYAHSTLEAIALIREREQLDPSSIAKITVRSLTDLVTYMNEPAPEDIIAAQFSVPFLVAVMTLRGQITLTDFDDATLRDPTIARLANTVTIVPDHEADFVYNATHSELRSSVTIATVDGRELSETVRFPKGETANPLEADELVAKFATLAEPVLGRAGAETLQNAVFKLDSLEDVKHLTSLLVSPKSS